MKKLLPAVLGLALALGGLTACGGTDDDTSSQAGSTTDAVAGAPSGEAPKVDRDPKGTLPEISFGADGVPTMTAIKADPPSVISVATLTAGDGAEVLAGDFVTVNYAGFLWSDGTQFDSSFDAGQPTSFSLNQVVDGWKYGLVGTKVGDRVQVVIPPEYGYGDEDAGSIPGGSTLVFVIDILDTLSVTTDALRAATPTDAALPDGLTVEGELGQEPRISFAEGAAAPTESQVIVLAEGTGPAIAETDSLFYHVTGGYWGDEVGGTWTDSYQSVDGGGGVETIGKTVGSRVLLVYPADEASDMPAQVLVLDLLAARPMA